MHSNSPEKSPTDPYQIIFREEERFAREAALALLVTRDLPLWRTAIPGMFLLDFLERGKMIRRIRSYYLPPRSAALAAAQNHGGKPSDEPMTAESLEELHADTADWLRQNEGARQVFFRLVAVLANHYATLAAASGKTFVDLARKAYGGAEAFAAIEQQISSLESEWSSAVKSESNIAPIPEHHMQEFIARRQRRVEQIFSA